MKKKKKQQGLLAGRLLIVILLVVMALYGFFIGPVRYALTNDFCRRADRFLAVFGF
jgi:hypothetical protein